MVWKTQRSLSPIHFVRAAKCNSGIEPQGLRLKNAWCRAPSSRSSECVHGNAIAERERATPYSLTRRLWSIVLWAGRGRAPSLERMTPGLAPRAGGDTQNVEKHCPCPTSNTLEREYMGILFLKIDSCKGNTFIDLVLFRRTVLCLVLLLFFLG